MKKIPFLLMILLSIVSCKQNSSSSDYDLSGVDTSAVEVDTTLYSSTKKNKVDSALVKKLSPLFKEKKDEFSEDKTSWFTPMSAPKYRNMNGVYFYFSENNFRLVLQYHKDNWLFIRKCIFLIDGKPYELIPEEFKRDNDESGITEWFDESMSFRTEMINLIKESKTIKIKFVGEQYVDYMILTNKQIKSLQNTISYFESLGYSY